MIDLDVGGDDEIGSRLGRGMDYICGPTSTVSIVVYQLRNSANGDCDIISTVSRHRSTKAMTAWRSHSTALELGQSFSVSDPTQLNTIGQTSNFNSFQAVNSPPGSFSLG